MHVLRYLPALVYVCACAACGSGDGVRPGDLDPEPVTVAEPVDQVAPGTLRHFVSFKYGPDVSEERIAQISARFAALQDSIPGITAFEAGVNNSPEGLNKDITHAYLLTFSDAAARDAYLPHPAHQRFVELLDGAVADVFVFDYAVGGK